MKAFNNYLKQFPHYTPNVFGMAVPYLKTKTIDAGEFFLDHGSVCKSVGFIEEGLLRQYYLNDGTEVTSCFCKANSITTSYRSFITGQGSELAIQAVVPTKLTVLSYDNLQILYKKDSFWQQVGRLSAEHEFLSTEYHNRFLQDLTATERYLQIVENEPELLQQVPLNQLASYLQITPETLSRIRKNIFQT